MINALFEKVRDRPNQKFTIILGSGFHCQFVGSDSILSSWKSLLKKLNCDIQITGDYHLDFERIIQSEKTPIEDSSITEKRLLKRVKDLLGEEQKRVLRDCMNCYPVWLFNPQYVSDVISLNFDEIPELVLNSQDGLVLGNFTNNSEFNGESKDSYSFLTTRYKSVDFGNNQYINFWHPHGVIANTRSIILGFHRYAHALTSTLRLRKHHMKLKKHGRTDTTWYQAILQNPVLIIGAGMSAAELDLWFALTSRSRRNDSSLPVFHMRDCECDVQGQWFEPLFTRLKYDKQWSELENIFTGNGIPTA